MGIPTAQTNYESAGLPRGGGWGNVTNITFDHVDLTGAEHAFSLDQNGGNNGSSTTGTSKILMSDIYINDFYGNLTETGNPATITCSNVEPCYNIFFTNNTVQGSTGKKLTGSCSLTEPGGIHGLSGC
jgi:galacturan 1,4-alpha-galacturonidase